MSKKSNPTLIGAFVVGAVALLAIGVSLFGGAELFAKRSAFIAYFPGPARGLREGSNVTMNGVNIGYVSDLVLHVNLDTFENLTAVTLELLPESILFNKGGEVIGTGLVNQTPPAELITAGGLRAQLKTENLVTGQLRVELAFMPNTPIVMRGGHNPPLREIPTVPSDIERILVNVEQWITELTRDLDAEDLSLRVQRILRGLDELANSRELRDSLAGASSMINSDGMQQLGTSLEAAIGEFRSVLADASALLTNADAKLDTDMKPLIVKLSATLDEAQSVLAAAKMQLRGDSMQGYELGGALREIEAAARALREFLDYLDRNPEAILQGKKK
jgi:paraquat-inducible protein B